MTAQRRLTRSGALGVLPLLSLLAACTTTSVSAEEVPAQVLDLTNWKLQTFLKDPSDGGVLEVKQPELGMYSNDPWFLVNEQGSVSFAASAGGETTSGSQSPRMELREMVSGGSENAEWQITRSKKQVLQLSGSVERLPPVNPAVVVAQIHAGKASDHVPFMLKLVCQAGKPDEPCTLWVVMFGKRPGSLDTNYTLGTPYTIKVVAGKGKVQVYYNDMSSAKISQSVDGFDAAVYFKAGCYMQTNTDRGEAADAVGEVRISELKRWEE